MSRVLIAEDELLVALDLELLVQQQVPGAEVVICCSVAEAHEATNKGLDFALLDIDVLDGKTFALARHLKERGVPFAFVSGAKMTEVPDALRNAPFVPKPFTPDVIAHTCQAVLRTEKRARWTTNC